MNITTLDLVEISYEEAEILNGGGKGFWAWLGQEIIENWDEIKRGISDGWNGTYNPK